MTDAPYRSAPARPCPGCNQPLTVQGSTFACSARACGEWLPAALLRALVVAENTGEVLSFEGFRDPVARCPDCRHEMEGWIWSNAVFRRCTRHGVWLEMWARTAFHAQLAANDEREKVILALADSLGSADGRLELARRLISLERRVAELEKK